MMDGTLSRFATVGHHAGRSEGGAGAGGSQTEGGSPAPLPSAPFWLAIVFACACVVVALIACLPQTVASRSDMVVRPAAFALDLTAFRQGFDRAEALEHPGSPASGAIADCSHMPDGSDQCTTVDTGFQRSVSLMRAAGLIDHAAKQSVLIVLQHGSDNRVASVEVDGTRADQANALRFSDVVDDVLVALHARPDADASALKTRLGLMAGDSDAAINEPRAVVLPGARVECIRSRSSVSNAVRCMFHPNA